MELKESAYTRVGLIGLDKNYDESSACSCTYEKATKGHLYCIVHSNTAGIFSTPPLVPSQERRQLFF